jgi:hypothetical protein
VFEAFRQSWQTTKARIQAQVVAEAEQRASAPDSLVPRAAEMPAIAREFVANCQAQDVALDYTTTTLPVFDQWIAGARTLLADADVRRENNAGVLAAKCVLWTTAYAGEVLRHSTGGPWLDASGQPAIRLGASSNLYPLVVAADLLQHGAAKAGDQLVCTMREYVDLAVDVQHRMALLAVFAGCAAPDELETAMSDNQALSDWLARQCMSAVKTAGATWGVNLDFSLDSVDGLERILASLHGMQASAPPLERATDDQVKQAIATWGAYLGEVLRRVYGGRWSLDPESRGLKLVISGTTIWPLGKVQKRLLEGEPDNVAFFAHVVGKVLSGQIGGSAAPPASKAS